MRPYLGSLASSLFLIAAVLPASADVSGEYRVEGRAPDSKESYLGKVIVAKQGDTYRVAWQIDRQLAVGTGILDGDSFAVIYTNVAPRGGLPGLAVYRTGAEGVLTGRYTMLGARATGIEAWIPAEPAAQ